MKKSELTKGLWLNRAVYAFLRGIGTWLIKLNFRLASRVCRPTSEPFLLVSNHNSDLDPFFICITVRKYIRFVASDHIFRKKVSGWFIKTLASPIPKRKGADSSEVMDSMRKNLEAGVNVALFAEGNRSFNGRTGFFSPRTGKLVSECPGSLITFRIDRGYLQSPRWAKHMRKGRISAAVVGEYPRSMLEKMTPDEINALIARDLYSDAYADQRAKPEKYTGKDLAESLENVLYICPKCRGVATMSGHGDDFSCSACGHSVKYGEYGFFEGDTQFDNIYDWDMWQRGVWKEICLRAKPDEILTSDSGQNISHIRGGHKALLGTDGVITLYRDRIELCAAGKTTVLPIEQIGGVAVMGANRLGITCGEDYYDIRCTVPRSGVKYFAAQRFLSGREYK